MFDEVAYPYKLSGPISLDPISHGNDGLFWGGRRLDADPLYINKLDTINSHWGVTLAQLVKASVGQADVQRFEPPLGRNWLSCGVFLVKSRHFGLPLAQTIRPNWQSLLAGGSVAI